MYNNVMASTTSLHRSSFRLLLLLKLLLPLPGLIFAFLNRAETSKGSGLHLRADSSGMGAVLIYGKETGIDGWGLPGNMTTIGTAKKDGETQRLLYWGDAISLNDSNRTIWTLKQFR